MALGFVRTALPLALALLLSGSGVHHAAAATNVTTAADVGTLVGWFDCSPVTFADEIEYVTRGASATSLPTAQCATFQAPLCHAGVCEDTKKRTIDVFVKRIQAKDAPATKPIVWFFQGGPGAASPTMELAMTALYKELQGNVNVYTMDHRGTGRSTLLDCTAAQVTTTGSVNANDLSPSEVADCAMELQLKFGNDLSAFSITSAANDIARFIATYQTGSKVTVYGVSYGTALVERLMHLNVPEIVGYVLDGVATTSGSAATDGMYLSNWDTHFGDAADAYMALCAADVKCAARFATRSLDAVIQSIIKEEHSVFCTMSGVAYDPNDGSGTNGLKVMLGRLLMSASTRTAIPVLAYRMQRCRDGDAAAVYNVAYNFFKQLAAASEEDAFQSTLLYYLIVFSEMWEDDPVPSASTLASRFEDATLSTGPIGALLPLYCAFTKSNATVCPSSSSSASTLSNYKANPIAYKKDKYWNVAATIPPQASVLILSGKLDPQTPHKYAERLHTALNGTNKELVAFEYAAHGTLFATALPNAVAGDATCGMTILASYVAGSGDLRQLNKACVAKLTMTFEMPNALAMRMFNASEAYDGSANYYFSRQPGTLDFSIGDKTEEKYMTAFIGVAIAAVVLAAIAAALHRRKVVKRRNAAAAATTTTSEHLFTEDEDVGSKSPSAARGPYVGTH